MKLNEKQHALVLRYFETSGMQTQAQCAIDVGYKAKNAHVVACQILNKPESQALLAKLREDAAERVGLTREGVLRELKALVHSDATHYEIDEDGRITVAPDAPPEASRALSKIKMKRSTKVGKDGEAFETVDSEFGLWNKNDAIGKAMKHLGMLDETIEHNVIHSWADLVEPDESSE